MPPHPLPFILVAVGIIVAVLVTLAVVASKRLAEKRRAEMDAAMRDAGFETITDPEQSPRLDWVGSIKGLSGGTRNITNAWAGLVDDRDIELVQHRYVISTGQTTQVILHRIAAAPMPAHWPIVRLSAENVFTKLGAAFGLRDVQVEDEKFNQRWRIKTDDAEFAQLLLGQSVQAILRDAQPGQSWMVTAGRLIVIERGRFEAAHLPRMTEMLVRVADAIPPELAAWEAQETHEPNDLR
ncbi:MAG: hypothetical protein KAS72_09575 [Phycisphaerales bacterium]|nr:hypothetical protein [Phycisphaerales bacterium]